jgi:hypothetical protein
VSWCHGSKHGGMVSSMVSWCNFPLVSHFFVCCKCFHSNPCLGGIPLLREKGSSRPTEATDLTVNCCLSHQIQAKRHEREDTSSNKACASRTRSKKRGAASIGKTRGEGSAGREGYENDSLCAQRIDREGRANTLQARCVCRGQPLDQPRDEPPKVQTQCRAPVVCWFSRGCGSCVSSKCERS